MDLRLNPSSLCRCCLSSEGELRPIFNPAGCVREAVFIFTAVKVTKGDGLPENICTNCLNQLNRCVRFKEQVEESDLVLRKHLKVSQNGNLEAPKGNDYICSQCGRSYASKYTYNRHTKVHEPGNDALRCNECGRRFGSLPVLKDHMKCHAKRITPLESLHKCMLCDESFATANDLLVHGSLHNKADPPTCNSCGKNFDSLKKLRRHLPTHFVEKPFKCDICPMTFSEMASLTRHYQKHTGAKTSILEICSVCGKSFPNRYTLKVHMRCHTGERPWECDTCPKRFTDFRLLNSHKLLHEDDRPHECEKCNKRFRHQSSLAAHIQTHDSDRPYRCNVCKKAYKQSWSLRIHKRIHTSSTKRFLCDQCTHMFATEGALKDHLREHGNQVIEDDETSPTSFQCKECSARLPSRLDLITHEKLTHALAHECDTCFGKWKTLEELVRHKCNEAALDNEPTPDEMILLPNGQVQDCNAVVNALLATMSQPSTMTGDKTQVS